MTQRLKTSIKLQSFEKCDLATGRKFLEVVQGGEKKVNPYAFYFIHLIMEATTEIEE